MGRDYQEKVRILIKALGGADNIVSAANCMTRLRVTVKNEKYVDEETLRSLDDVMELVHDRACYYEIVVGPGKSRKYADEFRAEGISSLSEEAAGNEDRATDWRANKNALKGKQNNSRLRTALKTIGDIFVPLIPGIITAGLCAGIAALIAQIVPDYESRKIWNLLYQLLTLLNTSFMTYITAWAGYRAAERFGATPILGGMLGMITSLEGINQIAKLLGLYDEQSPLNSVLRTGKGGVLAVIAGVLLLSFVEKKIRSKMPESLDVVFTPLLSLLACVIPYILVIMPLFGWISGGIVWVFGNLCMSQNIFVRIIAGYVSTALFLPLVAAGMHHGLVALYSVQLQEFGYITLYPALAMAGAGQVGAAIALWVKAKKAGNRKLCSVITGALPAGLLGIGEPLIYGVTLPLGEPFITAGLGAGFGGALVMAFEVAATTWGPSGLLGVFVMTAGPLGAVKSVLIYLSGLLISYVCSFIITMLFVNNRLLMPDEHPGVHAGRSRGANSDGTSEPEHPELSAGKAGTAFGRDMIKTDLSEDYCIVRHGDSIFPGEASTHFLYRIKDPAGIHARSAGLLAQAAKCYECEVTISANGKSASAGSILELMNLGASEGTILAVSAEGKEAREGAWAVKKYLQQNL